MACAVLVGVSPPPAEAGLARNTGALARTPSGTADRPSGWFPDAPSPRDGLFVLLVADQSCDQRPLTRQKLDDLVHAAATLAAWHEGDLGVAGLRNNSILELEFEFTSFRSTKRSDEAVRRDLWRQRNEAPVADLVRHIERARRGPCRTDLLEGLRQVQAELSSRAVGTRPVAVVLVTNGVVVARGMNFRKPQPNARELVRRLQREGHVARLPRVRLVFVGVGRTWGIGSRQQSWLNAFWSEYARAANASPALMRGVDSLIARIRGGG